MSRKKAVKRWYHPGVETGWQKDLDIKTRRELALRAHKGDLLATARSLMALSNVSTDPSTKAKSGADARYFYNEHRKTG